MGYNQRLIQIKRKYDNLAKGYDDIFTYKINKAENDIVGNLLVQAEIDLFLFDRYRNWGRILDLGCGTALALDFISPGKYVGIDISPEMIKKARLKFPKEKYPKYDFKVGDMMNIKRFKASSFDMAISLFNSFSYALDPHEFARRIHRVLRPKGICIAMVYNTRVKKNIGITNTTYDDKLALSYNMSQIREVFKDFKTVEINGLNYFGNLFPNVNGHYLRGEYWLLRKVLPTWARHTIIIARK